MGSTRTVFILGAGVMQLPALRLARELGWFVAAADGNPAAPGASLADRFFPVDLKDAAGLLAAAKGLRAERGLSAVFTAGTDFSAQVAFLAERLGLPGHSVEAARAASDKLLMRAVFERAGLPSPRFVELRAQEDPASLAAGLGLPLVVKPADNMGARGCRLARTKAELAAAVAAALPLSRTGRVIVEEYIEGPEFSLDALVIDGELQLRGFADRHINFEPYFVEMGHTMPTAAEPALVEAVLKVFQAGVAALGLRNGAAKGDMKWCPSRGTPVIGEIAARLSGGYMSGWTYPYASGLEPTREALEIAAGIIPAPAPPDRGWTSAERAFISIPGSLAAISGLREAENSPYVKNLFLRVTPGDPLRFPSNNVEKCGNVISQAPDRTSAIDAAEGAARSILLRLAPAQPETEAFLRGESSDSAGLEGEWPPAAFSLPEELAGALAALPEHIEGGQRMDSPPEAWTAKDLRVVEFPGASLVGTKDWQGRGFLESAEAAVRIAGARIVPSAELGLADVALAGRFWRALARGGLQGALYVLDTAASFTGEGRGRS